MWPPEPDEPDEVEVICEGWCLDEGLEIVWFAYGSRIPDEEDWDFEPTDQDEVTCPWCGGLEWAVC